MQQLELAGREREKCMSEEIAGTASVASESKSRADELHSRLGQTREVVQRLEEEGEQLRKEVREGISQVTVTNRKQELDSLLSFLPCPLTFVPS